MKKPIARRYQDVSKTLVSTRIPKDVQEFLEEIIHEFGLGHRGEQFAHWAAVKASFILEYNDLLY